MKEYKKRYWPMVVWALALMPVMLGAYYGARALGAEENGCMLAMLLAMLGMLMALMLLIWRGEHVYWLTGGPDFEAAKQAGQAARREYGRRHFIVMGRAALAAAALSVGAYFLNLAEWAMPLVLAVCIVAGAISTMKIKWEET